MSTLNVNTIRNEAGTGAPDFPNGIRIPATNALPDPENRIINGAFDFWQRGTSSTSNGYVAADRWFNNLNGGIVTQSRQFFALGDTLGKNIPTYFLRQSVSGQSLSNHYGLTMQRVESVRSFAGQTITILGWARRSSGSGNMVVEAGQNFGTGGSPSSQVNNLGNTTISLTGFFEPFAVTIAVPSITGKTLGTNGNDYFEVNFWASAGSSFNARTNSLGIQTIGVDLWGIHIKRGTHTTDAVNLYKAPELGPELARCQRYYENAVISAGVSSVYQIANFTLGATRFGGAWRVEKRATPTVTGDGTISGATAKGFNVVIGTSHSSTGYRFDTIDAEI